MASTSAGWVSGVMRGLLKCPPSGWAKPSAAGPETDCEVQARIARASNDISSDRGRAKAVSRRSTNPLSAGARGLPTQRRRGRFDGVTGRSVRGPSLRARSAIDPSARPGQRPRIRPECAVGGSAGGGLVEQPGHVALAGHPAGGQCLARGKPGQGAALAGAGHQEQHVPEEARAGKVRVMRGTNGSRPASGTGATSRSVSPTAAYPGTATRCARPRRCRAGRDRTADGRDRACRPRRSRAGSARRPAPRLRRPRRRG